MFNYYGSKSKIIDYYPSPKYGKIIEPFAGSARYSLKYFDRDVLLVDKYEVIIKIWKWLQKASKQDIMNLPEPKAREDIRNYKFDCEESIMLMRFIIGAGLSNPQWTVSPQNFGGGVKKCKKNIAQQLYKIKHWEIKLDDYRNIENEKATWFIDPPYENGGHRYVHNNKTIDYNLLADWCKERKGQVIVCENSKARWLPFRQMANLHGSRFNTKEVIWSNQRTNYDCEQLRMFL